MSELRQPLLQSIDFITVALYVLLVLFGWSTIYAASYDVQNTALLDIHGRTGSQMMWMGISLVAALLILLTDVHFLKGITPWFYTFMMLLLVATIFLAPDIKGSHSWLVITPSVRLQPAEFAKVSTALMLALWCSRYEFTITSRRDIVVALGIFLLPMGTIILQNETGSAIVFATFFIVLYREGFTGSIMLLGFFLATLAILSLKLSGVMWGATDADLLVVMLLVYGGVLLATSIYGHAPHLLLVAAAILLAAFLPTGIAAFFTPVNFGIVAFVSLALLVLYLLVTWLLHKGKTLLPILLFGLFSALSYSGIDYFFNNVLQEHQQKRILVSLGLKDDPSGAGYNVNQSLIAIGSGGMWGKGYLNGTQTKLQYVPEQDTDFIFCTIGEEWGFVGSTVLLSLFLVLLLRLIHLAERQSEAFARIYGYSVACILFFHLVINIGMVIGLVPVIGIPLPFFSYGGSSLLSFTILLFIFIRLDASFKER